MKLCIHTKSREKIKFKDLDITIITKFVDSYVEVYREDLIFTIWSGTRKVVVPFKEISYYEITE